MAAGRLRRAVKTALLTAFIPMTAYAGDLQEKIGYCKNCHGSSGQGFKGYYTAPRLAGQQLEYLENQFKAISLHTRDDPLAKQFMWPAMGSVEPGMRRAVAQYYSRLDSRPAADGPKGLISAGKKIFEEGVPDADVPACAACHGPDAKGTDAFPRLAGQLYAYNVAQLKGWGKGYRSKSSISTGEPNIMLPIATAMSDAQIAAVAAYLSYQR